MAGPNGSEFSLDEARDSFFKLHRAGQRFADGISKLVDSLNQRTPDQAWMLQVVEEAQKGVTFHEQQLSAWQALAVRAEEHVAALRREAELQAMQELRDRCGAPGTTTTTTKSTAMSSTAGDGGGDDAWESQTQSFEAAGSTAQTVHPELLKFKLEKQAKILGKYGGVPAIGSGLVLPRPSKDMILKATASPAAREIQYSRVENRDACDLAQVMRFKARKSGAGAGEVLPEAQDGCSISSSAVTAAAPGGGAPLSPWQAELGARVRMGRPSLVQADCDDTSASTPPVHAACASELAAALRQRAASLAAGQQRQAEQARDAARAAGQAAGGAGPGVGPACNELAQVLLRRQSLVSSQQAPCTSLTSSCQEDAAPQPQDHINQPSIFAFTTSCSALSSPRTPLPLTQRSSSLTAQGSVQAGSSSNVAGAVAEGSTPPTAQELQPAMPGLVT